MRKELPRFFYPYTVVNISGICVGITTEAEGPSPRPARRAQPPARGKFTMTFSRTGPTDAQQLLSIELPAHRWTRWELTYNNRSEGLFCVAFLKTELFVETRATACNEVLSNVRGTSLNPSPPPPPSPTTSYPAEISSGLHLTPCRWLLYTKMRLTMNRLFIYTKWCTYINIHWFATRNITPVFPKGVGRAHKKKRYICVSRLFWPILGHFLIHLHWCYKGNDLNDCLHWLDFYTVESTDSHLHYIF